MSRRGALHGMLGRAGECLALAERPFAALLDLRGNGTDAAFRGAVESAFGLRLPVEANTAVREGERTLLWQGPDEWLAMAPDGERAALLAALRGALAGQHAAVSDVSEGNVVLVLDAPQAADILGRGCPLDFHESAFPVGACAQSVFHKTGILLLREAPQRFVLVVRRSFARYFYAAFQDAARMELL